MSEAERPNNQYISGSGSGSGSGSTKGTFEITIKFTQNSTWQGQIHCIEKNQKQNFRSALEMLRLMDEALTENNEDEW